MRLQSRWPELSQMDPEPVDISLNFVYIERNRTAIYVTIQSEDLRKKVFLFYMKV